MTKYKIGDRVMTPEQILKDAYYKILKEHNIVLTDVAFDVVRTKDGQYTVYEIEIRGKTV